MFHLVRRLNGVFLLSGTCGFRRSGGLVASVPNNKSSSTLASFRELSEKLDQHRRIEQRRSSLQNSLQKLASRVCDHYSRLAPIVLSQSTDGLCQRQEFLKHLAFDIAENDTEIDCAIRSYKRLSTDSQLRRSQCRLRLQEACTPNYEGVFKCLIQQNATETLRLILSLRQDVLQWKPYLKSNPPPVTVDPLGDFVMNLEQLDSFLRQLLSTWFSPSLLEIRRMQYHTTPASIIETIAKQEAVHPVKDLEDLRQRFGPDRRVYALFHRLLPEIPLVVLHTALQNQIPSNMDQVYTAGALVDDANVAAFYSISNLQSGLTGVGLGEHLIKETVSQLQQGERLEKFVTLSPIPKFRKWLENLEAESVDSTGYLPQHVLGQLIDVLEVTPEQGIQKMVQVLQEQGRDSFEKYGDVFRPALSSLAARYLLNVKHRSRPFDAVARFHIGNGAFLYRINILADKSRKGWHNSFGVMVNYVYDLPMVAQRQNQYETDYSISSSRQVQALL